MDFSTLPVKVLQFGEGNFLRAFADYLMDRSNECGDFGGSIAVIKPRGDKPQNKGDRLQQRKGDQNQNQNKNGGKGNRDKMPKPDVPVPKTETGETPAPVAVPEGGAATVPFSRKRRPRRRSFGPKTPGGSGEQKA